MIRAIIFDMDGVLIDAKEWHYEALNKALEMFGYVITREEHETTFDGLPTKKKLEMLSVCKGLPEYLHELISVKKQQFTIQIAEERCFPIPQKERLLKELKHRGYKLAVASNSIRHTVRVMMEKAHLAKYLDLQLSNEDVAQAKPHPEIYLKAIHTLGCVPAECLVVEDNENGIKAATASGAYVMPVKGVDEVTIERIEEKLRDL